MLDDDRYLAQLCGLAANPSLPRQLLDRLVTAASGELHDQPGAFELLDHPLEPRSRLGVDERRSRTSSPRHTAQPSWCRRAS